jgi:MFS family permease
LFKRDKHLKITKTLNDEDLAALREPRNDLVAEKLVGEDRYELLHGPFSEYERHLSVKTESEGVNQVVESFSWRLSIPFWGIFFSFLIGKALPKRSKPWWSPPDRLNERAARVLGILACIQVIDGYLGSVITQTITFAADEFDHSSSAQGITLAVIRVGILISLGVLVIADKKGRRNILLLTLIISVLTTALGSLSPNFWFLGGTQLIARGLTTGMGILIGVIAAEELPKGSRAYGVSMLSLSAALGAGISVWVLPIADLNQKGWRIVYLVPLIFLPALMKISKNLPESLRYKANSEIVEPITSNMLNRKDKGSFINKRLLLLAAVGFLLLIFAAPASQFQNDFLREHRGYSASGITAYWLLTSTPAGIAIFLAGRFADTHGRKKIATSGVLGGTVFIVLSYYFSGVLMWTSHLFGAVLGSLTVALGVYGPELFSTNQRARSNGIIVAFGVLGSATGLLLVGYMTDLFDNYGHAFAIVATGPLLAAILIISKFPETARVELEDLNPGDIRPEISES